LTNIPATAASSGIAAAGSPISAHGVSNGTRGSASQPIDAVNTEGGYARR
jgi:hypothetical protein